VPIAKAVLYAAPPGALAPDFANIPYTKLKHPYWPKVEHPFKATYRLRSPASVSPVMVR
jgi:microcystin degradation protein MlrC